MLHTKRPCGKNKECNKFQISKKYICVKSFHFEFDPIVYRLEKGEIVKFEGKSLYAHFKKENGSLVLLNTKEAFRILREL